MTNTPRQHPARRGPQRPQLVGWLASAVATLVLAGCGHTQPHPHTAPTPVAPAAPPAAPPPTAPTLAGPASVLPAPAAAPGGLFGPPLAPAPATAATTTPAARLEVTDPEAVARAFATGLFTVDWTQPFPVRQKLAATTPWATPNATSKLAHGDAYQPDRTDTRVASGQVDTVDKVDIAPADPEPPAMTYVATIHLSTRTRTTRITSQAQLVLSVTQTGGRWLVDDARLVA